MPMSRRSSLSALTLATIAALSASLLSAPAAFAAADGTVTGTVTGADNAAGLLGVRVEVFDAAGTQFFPVGETITDVNGSYSFTLPAGAYSLYFSTRVVSGSPTYNYVSEWSGDSFFHSGAVPIAVPAGGSVASDAVLELGGSITGAMTVNAEVGSFFANAFAFDDESKAWVIQGHSAIDSTTFDPLTSTYSIKGLSPSHQYLVRFTYSCEGFDCLRLQPQLWNDTISTPDATPVAVTAGVATTGISAEFSTSNRIPDSSRIAGDSRYTTSAEIAESYPADVDVVYLASGANYPDALSAAPAAATLDAPLLLTAPDHLPEAIAVQLERLSPARVVIAGGFGSVSADVEEEVQALLDGVVIDRMAGADRYETSRLIVADAFGDGVKTVWIATGRNFADALSAAPAAGGLGQPVLLVDGSAGSIDAATRTLIDDLDATSVWVLGGPTTVSDGVQASLDAIPDIATAYRIAGEDRFATSVQINVTRFGNTSFLEGGPMMDKIYIASGLGFADALSGAALAGRDGAPMYTVPTSCVPLGTRYWIWQGTPGELVIFGGPPSVGTPVESLTLC